MHWIEIIARSVGPMLGLIGAVLIWLMQRRHEARVKAQHEAETQRRMLIALRQELLLNVEAQFAQFGPDAATVLKPRLLAELHQASKGEHSMPMGVAASENAIFDALKADIMTLPEPVISPVVRYYQQDDNIASLLKAFGEGQFEKLSLDRRARAIEQLFVVGQAAVIAGCDAFDAVHAALHEKPETLSTDPNRIRQALLATSNEAPSDQTITTGGP